ncbi:MAG: hypothetical protein K9K66_01295 [Desulfarculaceae bacterium]|nr:hypothetical protein [Desulfarculaceae bacterium]MCF8072348.1 hypothetical protein [Desulfarculaceae bacterium]MCF8100269.1 hypothetical protein [Desulfarculaceae bacterium]MCF8116158.1 hypothetical protein [Desulfarculaceae bacterium]
MPVTAKDFFRGAALSLVLGHPACRKLEPLDPDQGRYLVNGALHLWLRHEKQKSPWSFVFSPAELAALKTDLDEGGAFLGLTCGRDAVIGLAPSQIGQALDFTSSREQALLITRVPGRQCSVAGPGGELPGLIPGSAFPGLLFERD